MIKNDTQPIAILMATYNGEAYIEEMLRSLEKQTEQAFVCYIHDDGSDDRTPRILAAWQEAHPTKYVILSGERKGSAKDNFLWMMSQVESDYYMFADQDDVWLPEKIEKSIKKIRQMEILCQDSCRSFCAFTDMYVVDDSLEMIHPSFIRYIGRDPYRTSYPQIIIDNPAAGCTMIFNREHRNLAMHLSDSSRIEMHDVWVLALAAACGKEHVGVVDEPCVYYRQHENNEMGAKAEGVTEKIWRNLRGVYSGDLLTKKRIFLQHGRDLAGQMCLVEDLPEKSRKILAEFSDIASRSKWERISFYRKYGFTRNHGTLWMYLFV